MLRGVLVIRRQGQCKINVMRLKTGNVRLCNCFLQFSLIADDALASREITCGVGAKRAQWNAEKDWYLLVMYSMFLRADRMYLGE